MQQTFTKDQIVVGAKLRNNDPRKNGEVIEVIAVLTTGGERRAYYQSAKRKVSVKFDRIFTDGRTRAQGFNLVSSPVASLVASAA